MRNKKESVLPGIELGDPNFITKPKKRAPEGFHISLDLAEWAKLKCPHVDAEYQTECFLDWEFKFDHMDWKACWRTWMRRAEENEKAKGALIANMFGSKI